MPSFIDGPASSLFTALPLAGNADFATLPEACSEIMREYAPQAPSGDCVMRGMPFRVEWPVLLHEQVVECPFAPVSARWLVFMHTSDLRPFRDEHGVPIPPVRGATQLGEHAADYVIIYADGREVRVPVRRRFQMGLFRQLGSWGENSFEAVIHPKFTTIRGQHEQPGAEWDEAQVRVGVAGRSVAWLNWLWAWENPRPGVPIAAIRFEPVSGIVLVSGVSAGQVDLNPLRWEPRRKTVLSLPPGTAFDPSIDERGLLCHLQLDLGQVIVAAKQPQYDHAAWPQSNPERRLDYSENDILVEYTAHPQARFHLPDGSAYPALASTGSLREAPPARQRVTLRVVERGGSKPLPVRLHLHDVAGNYLAPADRNRHPNPCTFQDYGAEYVARNGHISTYIDGETAVDLPLGRVFVEITRGFEMRPLRTTVEITPDTETATLEVERALHWREKGWVTADTHVHLLPPVAALLQGTCEGVNVVNLLAIQCGEMVSNAQDFDGLTDWGAGVNGGEHLVRVGSENRHNILGHISLLGYGGRLIAPLSTGGPVEGALGEPSEALMTEWAMRCRAQDGIVVMPHYPAPKGEPAAVMASGNADAIELCVRIDPYALVDWYRFLNCGIMTAAVGGTDKMGAYVSIGALRTYARINPDEPFTYAAWKEAVRRAHTFATCGPLLDFTVNGRPMGSRLSLPAGGGTLDVQWQAESAVVPMTRIELIVNGEVRESRAIDPQSAAGYWSVKVESSAWLAVLLRGQYPGEAEAIMAHSSPVMVDVANSELLAAADAVTILEQIEGTIAYLDTVAPCPDERSYHRMRLLLTSTHRSLHNRLHAQSHYHHHSPVDDHEEHHAAK